MEKRKKRQKLGILAVVLLLFLYFFIYSPFRKIKSKFSLFMVSAKQLKEAFNKNDIDLLKKDITRVDKDYRELEKASRSIYWMSFIPYVSDFKNSVEAGKYLLSAGTSTIDSIVPYADLIGFKKGEASFINKSAEDRLQTAVLTLDKVLKNIDAIADDMARAEEKIKNINPKRYPNKLGKLILRSRIENVQEQLEGMVSLFVDAKPLLKKLPAILGKDKEKSYLVLFQNDKELRATGGFLTSYAIFKIKNGKMRIESSSDIYTLDKSIPVHPPAPRAIATYHLKVYKFNIRDSNLSPDFPTSVVLFDNLYKKSSLYRQYDGIFAIDTNVLVDLLKVFGDTKVDGVIFSAKTDKRCDCPQVIYKLSDIIDRPTPYLRENRKGIIGDLMYSLFYKAIGFSPSKYWGTLAQEMYKNIQEKHILLNFVDKDLQSSVESLNFAGKINDYFGDYLHVNNVNFAGAKSNMFVSQSIISKTSVDKKGLKRSLEINYRNPYRHSDCNLERGGLCLNATLRNWIRIYVPKGSKLVRFSGSLKLVQTYDELGKTVFEGFLKVEPMGIARVEVEYRLPKRISSHNYHLLIQKQAGTYGDGIKVIFKNKTIFKGKLDQDKEIIIK